MSRSREVAAATDDPRAGRLRPPTGPWVLPGFSPRSLWDHRWAATVAPTSLPIQLSTAVTTASLFW